MAVSVAQCSLSLRPPDVVTGHGRGRLKDLTLRIDIRDRQTDQVGRSGGVEGIIAGPFKKRGGHFVLRQKGNNALLSVGFVSARNVLFVPLLVHMHTYKV